MWIILGILIISIALGYLFRNKLNETRINNFFIYSVYLLLFLLGVSIGNDPSILGNLASMGFLSFIFSIATIGGSILVLYFVYILYFKRENQM